MTWLAVGVAGGLAACVTYYPVLTSHFRLLMGELGDTRLVNAILENWWLSVRGVANWKSPPFFFPQPGTLAYSEVLFLYLPFYVPARLLGISPYFALATTVLGLIALGYLSSVWLLHRVLRLPMWTAMLGALLFTFAGVRFSHYGHTQLFASLLVPIVFAVAFRYRQRLAAGDLALVPGIALAIGTAGLLFTSFYIGWFFLFFVLLFVFSQIITHLAASGRRLWPLVERRMLVSFAICGLAFAFAILPFISLYLPLYIQIGKRPWAGEVAKTLPLPVDLVNVGSGNLVWGDLIGHVIPMGRELEWELSYGTPPGLLLLFLLTTAVLVFARRRSWLGDINANPIAADLRLLAVSVLIAWLLMLRWDAASLWKVIYSVLPGGGAIRAVSRFQLVLRLALIVVAMYGLYALWRSARSAAGKTLVGFLCIFLLAEQIERHPPLFDVRSEEERLEVTQPPPPFCAHFLYLVGSPGTELEFAL